MRRAIVFVLTFAFCACDREDLWDWTFQNYPHDAAPVRGFMPVNPTGLEDKVLAFNPGLTDIDGNLWTAWRADRYDNPRCNVERAVAVAPLDGNTLSPRRRHVYLQIPSAQPCATDEDPRLFTHDGRTYMTYNACVMGSPEHCERRQMHLAEIQLGDDASRVAWTRELTAAHADVARTEKNWVSFSQPDGIGLVQHINPSVVFHVPDEQLALMRASGEPTGILTMASPTRAETPRMPDGLYGPWRGGTPAVYEPTLDAYISIAHSFVVVGNFEPERRIYFARAYAFAKHAPHAVTAYAEMPLHLPPASMRRHERSRIVFATGLVDRGDHYLLSYGHEDRDSGVAVLDKAKLLESLTPVH